MGKKGQLSLFGFSFSFLQPIFFFSNFFFFIIFFFFFFKIKSLKPTWQLLFTILTQGFQKGITAWQQGFSGEAETTDGPG